MILNPNLTNLYFNMNPKDAVKATTESPNDPAMHQGTSGANYLSKYIFDIYMSIKDNGTPEQLKKYAELQAAYTKIVGDLSHVYRLELLVGEYQHKLIESRRQNEYLKSEVEKLKKTIDFENLSA
jgi:hypothetical protein